MTLTDFFFFQSVMKHIKTCAYVSSRRVLYRDRHDAPRDFRPVTVDTRANFQNSCVPGQEGRERKIGPYNV